MSIIGFQEVDHDVLLNTIAKVQNQWPKIGHFNNIITVNAQTFYNPFKINALIQYAYKTEHTTFVVACKKYLFY